MKVYLIYDQGAPFETSTLLEIKDTEEKAKETVAMYEKERIEEEQINKEQCILSDRRYDFVTSNNCKKEKLTTDEEVELDNLFLRRCLSEREKYVNEYCMRYLDGVYYTEMEVT